MKKKRAVALAATSLGLSFLMVLGVSGQVLTEAGANLARYDVNGDGAIDISDVTALLSYLATDCAHVSVAVAGKEATCFEDGLTEGSYCSSCGKTLKEQTVIPAGHHYNGEGSCTGCGAALAEELDEQGFSYTQSPDGRYYILSSVGRNEDVAVTVPEKYNGLPVAAIGIGAFYGCKEITSVTLPESITAIGSLAFYGCENLSSVNLPQGVSYIGYSAFENCFALSEVTLPVGVTSVMDGTFKNCRSLSSVVLHSFVEKVGNHAFYGCEELESVKVGVGVCSFGKEAFYGCKSLKEVYINDLAAWCAADFESAESNPLFYGSALYVKNEPIVELELPQGVEKVSAYAFQNVSSIEALVLPEGLKTIGKSAFAGCRALLGVELPDSLAELEDGAFSTCTALTRVDLPSGLKTLGAYAFYNCFSLKTVYFPDALDVIRERSFAGCAALTRVVFPEQVRAIEQAAFFGCGALTSLDLPAGLRTIGKDAFYGCTKLKKVYIYDGLSAVEEGAFGGCDALLGVYAETLDGWCEIDFATADANPLYFSKTLYVDDELLTDLVIPYGVTRVGSYAFVGFGAERVSFPKGLKEIGKGAFWNCTALREVVLQRGVTAIGAEAFAGCSSLKTAELPKGLLTLGARSFEKCVSLSRIALPLGLDVIEEGTFAFCTSLEEVTVPDGLLKIGAGAFEGCGALSAAPLSKGLVAIEREAFKYCVSLLEVSLPDGLLTVGKDAFYGCSGLLKVHITDLSAYCEILFENLYASPIYYASALYLNGAKVTSVSLSADTVRVGDFAFVNYGALTSVRLSTAVRSIGKGAFMGCKSLSSVTAYDGMTEIGAHAFADCSALTGMYLSSTLVSIGDFAFEGCLKLSGLSLPRSLLAIGSSAFEGCASFSVSGLPTKLLALGDRAFAGCNVTAQLKMPETLVLVGDGVFAGCAGLTDLYCSFEAFPLGWSEEFHGGTGRVHLLPYWSYEGGSYIAHTPVVGAGKAPTCTEEGFTESVSCATCGKEFAVRQTLPALGGEHEYENGRCVRCGHYLPYTWTLENGVLTVTGKGAVAELSIEDYPWHNQRAEITEIIVSGDVTEIGAMAFSRCENVTKITLGETVSVIGSDAFSYNYALQELVFGHPVTKMGQGVVYLCNALERVTLTGQTKSEFLEVSSVNAYNDAFENVKSWTAESEQIFDGNLAVKGDEWQYLVYPEGYESALTGAPPAGWLTGSDSATWQTGSAPFTDVTFGQTFFSAFLRKTFILSEPSSLKEMVLQIKYDENPTVYLNGQLLWSAEGYYDAGYITVDLSDKISLLKEGENVLCVSFSNVYGGTVLDLSLVCSSEETVVDGAGNVLFEGAESAGFVYFGAVNAPENVLDGDQSTVCGSNFDAGTEQSVTVTFKGEVTVTDIYLQCKDEGTTSHADGITRGSYDVYLLSGSTFTKVGSVLARTEKDGGATLTLQEGVEATGVKIVITSWQGDCWACVADVMVKGEALS